MADDREASTSTPSFSVDRPIVPTSPPAASHPGSSTEPASNESHKPAANKPAANEPASNEPASNEPAEGLGASLPPEEALQPRPIIEIGWIVAGKLDDPDLKATRRARTEARQWLRTSYPDFDWKMPLVIREEAVRTQRVESVQLLDYGITERNLRHWDWTLLITPADLVSHYKSDAMAVISRALQSAVISTARIDPRAIHPSVSSDARVNVMASRLKALVLHVVGHLAGLEHEENAQSFMSDFQSLGELDQADHLGSEHRQELQQGLWAVADRRLEEQADMRTANSISFYARAAWINRRTILKAVIEARPWQFPFRLSRLTTAAASAMLVLVVTAEAWELGLSQPLGRLAITACAAISATTAYIVARQKLFVRRPHLKLSELTVVTNVSTLAIVLVGMVTTFVLLVVATFLTAQIYFGQELVENWAASAELHPSAWIAHLKLATFVASIGIFIGALGASFEQQNYFRHITYVDEEI